MFSMWTPLVFLIQVLQILGAIVPFLITLFKISTSLFCQWFPLLCRSFKLSHLFIFTFISFALGDRPKKILLPVRKRMFCLFSSKSLIVSIGHFTFRSLFHFEFIFVNGDRTCSNFIFNMSSLPKTTY